MAQKTIDFENDILEPIGSLKEDINVLGLEESVKTSLKCDYLENAPTMNIVADYVYTLGDKTKIFRNVKKIEVINTFKWWYRNDFFI